MRVVPQVLTWRDIAMPDSVGGRRVPRDAVTGKPLAAPVTAPVAAPSAPAPVEPPAVVAPPPPIQRQNTTIEPLPGVVGVESGDPPVAPPAEPMPVNEPSTEPPSLA